MERDALSSLRYHHDGRDEKLSTSIKHHFSMFFSLMQVQFFQSRHFTLSACLCLDLSSTASYAPLCAQIHCVKIGTSLSVLPDYLMSVAFILIEDERRNKMSAK